MRRMGSQEFSIGRWLEPHGGPKGLLKLCVLKLLREGDASGYELLLKVEAKTGGGWRPAPGSIYPILNQLKRSGLVQPVGGVGIRGQRKYRLTEQGGRALSELSSVFVRAASRWQSLRRLLLDLIEPEVLGDMMITVTMTHFQSWMDVVESNRIDNNKKLSFLRELALNLERQLTWAEGKIRSLEKDGLSIPPQRRRSERRTNRRRRPTIVQP